MRYDYIKEKFVKKKEVLRESEWFQWIREIVYLFGPHLSVPCVLPRVSVGLVGWGDGEGVRVEAACQSIVAVY